MWYTLDMQALQNKIGHGVECDVYDIGNGRCYKYYGDSRFEYNGLDIPTIYDAAAAAAEIGLAPNVYGYDDCGYTTEIVEVFNECDDKGLCGGQCEFCEDMPIDLDEWYKLKNKLSDLFGHDIRDLHVGNIGIKNGRLICIDFGFGIIS